jgi:polyisoprenoid-binding protein YceI
MSEPGILTLTSANTEVWFSVNWFGVLVIRGRFDDLEGVVHVPEGRLERATIAVDVRAASLGTGVALRDRHLRGHRFLDAGHPRITFRGAGVERVDRGLLLRGKLVLCGVERVMRLPVHQASAGAAPGTIRLSTSFAVTRAGHGIGLATGLRRFNPLLKAIGAVVRVDVSITAPASLLHPAAHALGR